jgi:hypothetical protein
MISAATAGLIIWDVIAVSVDGSRATVSNVLLAASYGHPVIPLFLGGLMTHLFWPGRAWGAGWVRVTVGALLLAGTAAAGFVAHLVIAPMFPLAIGMALGRLLVPQSLSKT